MIYIEFIDREPAIPREIFRYIGDQSASWVQADRDLYVGQLSRTMRLGPHPAYLTIFRAENLARVDDWESYYRSEGYNRNLRSFAFVRALKLVRDGCYDELLPTEQITEGIYYLEYFPCPDDCTDGEILDHFSGRTRQHDGANLAMLLRRIGHLAPDPGGIAAWRFANIARAEPMLRERHPGSAFRAVDAGLYRRFGTEVL